MGKHGEILKKYVSKKRHLVLIYWTKCDTAMPKAWALLIHNPYLKGPQSGPPPTLIEVLIQGSLLLQGTSINLFGGTFPPPRCKNGSLPTN